MVSTVILSQDLYTESCIVSLFYLLLHGSVTVMSESPLEMLSFSGGCSLGAGECVKRKIRRMSWFLIYHPCQTFAPTVYKWEICLLYVEAELMCTVYEIFHFMQICFFIYGIYYENLKKMHLKDTA